MNFIDSSRYYGVVPGRLENVYSASVDNPVQLSSGNFYILSCPYDFPVFLRKLMDCCVVCSCDGGYINPNSCDFLYLIYVIKDNPDLEVTWTAVVHEYSAARADRYPVAVDDTVSALWYADDGECVFSGNLNRCFSALDLLALKRSFSEEMGCSIDAVGVSFQRIRLSQDNPSSILQSDQRFCIIEWHCWTQNLGFSLNGTSSIMEGTLLPIFTGSGSKVSKGILDKFTLFDSFVLGTDSPTGLPVCEVDVLGYVLTVRQ